MIVNDIPEDSVEIYLQNEVLDASVTIQEDYQSKIDQNSQAKIQIQFKGTDSFNTTQEVIKFCSNPLKTKLLISVWRV